MIKELIKRKIIDEFHKLYYRNQSTMMKNTWFGVPMQKCPEDLQIYQEIISETKPDLIIETGTHEGGSALFFAHMLDVLGHGKVVTIDLHSCMMRHPRVQKFIGPSIDPMIIDAVKQTTKGNKKIMVVLDSNHEKDYVLREMELYSPFVSKGCYLVVEDTNINGHPVLKDFGDGPMEAVRDFLRTNKGFEVDRSRERLMLTTNPNGFLRRVG